MAKVDLIALAAELGVAPPADDGEYSAISLDIDSAQFTVYQDAVILFEAASARLTPDGWQTLDIVRRHVAPAPPVVLTAAERWNAAIAVFLERRERSPELETYHVLVSDRAELNGIVREVDAILAWFAANGITLTREARP